MLDDIEKKKILEFRVENARFNIKNDNNNITNTAKKQKPDDSSDDMMSGNEMSNEDENNDQYRTGRWHHSEHLRFIKGCLLHGNNWKKVKNFKQIIYLPYLFYFYFL